MSAKAFLKTNIFIYDVDAGAPKEKRRIATHLGGRSIDDGSGVISYQVIHEFVNVAPGS
jgi:predicted nucleic acid-binding protein